MSEIVGAVALYVILQEINCPLFQILQKNNVVFANLVVELTLEIILGLEVARAHPERLIVHFVRHDADKLHWHLFVCLMVKSIANFLRCQKWVWAESEDSQELDA